MVRRIGITIAVLVTCLIASPVFFTAHFAYIDQCSIPLWMAPKEVQHAVQRVLRDGERVRFINIDAFDYEHINVLTNQRLLRLDDLHSGVTYEIDLGDIADAAIDRADGRFLVVTSDSGDNERLFFVGSPRAFAGEL